MPKSFPDHFSRQADFYARFRPGYPQSLYDFLSDLAGDNRSCLLDIATGNGQAAVALADKYDRVLACDASSAQVKKAPAHPRVQYFVSRAEQIPLPDRCIDMITVAQAVHWFVFDAFYGEVRRLLKNGGLLAMWCYLLPESGKSKVDLILNHYYTDVVGKFWPPQRKLIDDGYQQIPFPFEKITTPTFEIITDWNQEDFIGYLHSWSATQACKQETGTDPLAQISQELKTVWPGNDSIRFHWPLILLAAYVE